MNLSRALDLVLAIAALLAGAVWAFVGAVVLTMSTTGFNFANTEPERLKLYGIMLLMALIAFGPPASAGYWVGVSFKLWRGRWLRAQAFAGGLAALSLAIPAALLRLYYFYLGV